MTLQFIAPTKRRRMSKARAARIFLRENGRCYICGKRLRIGVDRYQIEHPNPLSLGGSDADEDLRVICTECHKPKTAVDAKAKAKRDRLVTAGWTDRPRSKWPKGRSFPSARPRKNATTPHNKQIGQFGDSDA